jgi:DNA (cytosine-5)-methyltransferase 1
MIKPTEKSVKLPAVLDLFSGCGGLGLGFLEAGFPIAGSIDMDRSALETAKFNLHAEGKCITNSICINGDIRELNPLQILSNAAPEGLIVAGGPPCQSYSLAGRAKLRSLGEDRTHTKDKRGDLFKVFLDFAISLNATAVVMENVPEAMNYGGKSIPEIACRKLEKSGYKAIWTILNAANYGVPQKRNRMFLIAVNKRLGIDPSIPKPTHAASNPEENHNSRNFELLLKKFDYFVTPPKSKNPLPWVTVGDAISDLPSIFPTSSSPYRLHKPADSIRYLNTPKNAYQKIMRKNRQGLSGHGFRRTLRDFPIFELMHEGANYLDASRIAEELLKKKISNAGINPKDDKKRYELFKKNTVPPYDREKFPDKWKRLSRLKPSHTLPAHLGTDTYSHIHPTEPRGISVREAARLQSFPDEFVFPCSMTDAFKQIGNAVPPLLAYAIAKKIKSEIIKSHEKS